MDFELTQEQKMLAQAAADFAKKNSPVERLRRLRTMPKTEHFEQRHASVGDPRNWEPRVWKQMAELGWLGLFYPESVGGMGLRFFDASLVLERLGTTLVPEPYIASAVLAGWALLKAGTSEQHAMFLTPMIEGETSLALAWQEAHSRYDVRAVKTTARPSSAGFVLDGEKVFVLNGHAAEQLIVSARLEDGSLALFVVDSSAPGVNIESFMTMDANRAARVRLENTAVERSRLLSGNDAEAALDQAFDLAAAAACAEGVGIAKTLLTMTVEYLKVRRQFGVAIGTFQALQHRAVDMFVEAQLMESSTILATIRADEEDSDERRRAVSIAKTQLTTGGKFIAQQAIQLHGGIGVTDEHDVGLFFKRMHALQVLFGDDDFHVNRFAARPAFATTVGE